MGGNSRQRQTKKSSAGSSFSLFGLFRGRNSRPRRAEDSGDHEYVKAYKVYPSDEDRGRWVAEPGINQKASAYISSITSRWEKLAVQAN